MIQTYKDIKGRSWDEPGIPKWIFRAGNESLENLHPDIIDIYTKQLEDNPGYELFYFSEVDKLQFITDLNNPSLLLAYNTIVANAFKTDIFRYAILTTYGGVWMDFSMQTLVSLFEIIKDYKHIYVKDSAADDGIYNAFIVSPKNNWFLEKAIEKCIYNITNKIYGRTCLTITSPHMLGDLYKELYNVSSVPLGQVGDDTVFYNHRLPNQFIEASPDNNLIKIKHPNHYNMLYTTQERYNIIWDKRYMFGEPRVLNLYVAHQGSVGKILHKRNSNSIIVVGGYLEDKFEDGILKLNCNDSYCSLPDKIASMFKFVSSSPLFFEYTHFYKLDEDMEFIKPIDLPLSDYMGRFSPKELATRTSHFGRCEGHYWNDKPYEGDIHGWCDGGVGYILSRKAAEIIGKIDGKKFPVEDIMVCSELVSNGIHPVHTEVTEWYKPHRDVLKMKIKTYKDLKDRKWEGEGIPKWIFKTGPFAMHNLPEVIIELFSGIIDANPGYELFYFSNEDCMLSIVDHYGHDYLKLYNRLVPTAYQADFWRYLILNQYGGCYGDFTQLPLVPYDEIIEGVDRVFVRDDPSNKASLYNAYMCCKPGDIVVKKAIEISADNIKAARYGKGTLDVTGPIVLGQAFMKTMYKWTTPIKEHSLGYVKGSKILQHKPSGWYVCDHQKDLCITKQHFHQGLVYASDHKNIHYDQAWKERKVFRW